MLERKYYFARVAGNPQTVLSRISTAVTNADLATYIPLVKMERQASKEFYVFLAVESPTRGIPGGLVATLGRLGIRFFEDYPLQPDQIKTMVARQDIHIHGFNSLKYSSRNFESPGDPFDRSDTWRPTLASVEMCDLYERLLHWISARGQGNWDNFVQACQALKIADNRQSARSAFRRMNLLGHIECSSDGQSWSASQAAFVRFADREEAGYLTGQRTPKTLARVSNLRSLEQTQQLSYDGPHRVSFIASTSIEEDNADGLAIVEAGISSLKLAALLPDLQGWKDSLQSLSGFSTLSYNLEKWTGANFEACDTLYEKADVYYGESGMYRLSAHGRQASRRMTLFFDESSQRWLRGDWYGLRYLDMETGRRLTGVVHDSDNNSLLIPIDQRWPLLYERALTLASGLLPSHGNDDDCLLYSRIPLALARTLCCKLNVDLLEK